ncbi:hypothetical protein NC652_035027 [Populus alba x Populus x berolinensis]|nr:hypothetical protein NC652_035027 [Populus alba x Populus x berolinensis]
MAELQYRQRPREYVHAHTLPYCPFRRRERSAALNRAKAVNGKEVLQYSGGDVEVMSGLKADLDSCPRNFRYLWGPTEWNYGGTCRKRASPCSGVICPRKTLKILYDSSDFSL